MRITLAECLPLKLNIFSVVYSTLKEKVVEENENDDESPVSQPAASNSSNAPLLRGNDGQSHHACHNLALNKNLPSVFSFSVQFMQIIQFIHIMC